MSRNHSKPFAGGARIAPALLFLLLLLLGAGVALVASRAAGPVKASPQYAPPHASLPAPVLAGTPVCGPSWSAVTSPSPGSADNALAGVAVVSANDVWAVGYYSNTAGIAQTLIEHWDGAAWSVVPSPNPGNGSNYLQAVSAAASNDAWAVGYYVNGAAYQTLILRWDGAIWTQVASQSPGPVENYLYGVAVVSADDAWAVGYYNNGTLYRTLTLRWNGSAWSTVSSPNPLGLGSGLRGVAVVSTGSVWAVGAYANFSLAFQTLVIRWNGSSWSTVSSPNTGSADNALVAVAASSANDAWAVGTYSDGARYQTLTERWNGSAWTIVSSPSFGAGDNALGGVAALSANDAWAVGAYDTGSGFQSLALHWDGSAWTQAPSENPGAADNRLLAMAASGGDAWAVGSFRSAGPNQTLAERYANLPCQTGTATPTPANQTATSTATGTGTGTGTPPGTPPPTQTPAGGTPTATDTPGGPTPTPCTINFSDVHPEDYYYEPVTWLYCHGAISGYGDGTFKPGNLTTRGQLSKIVVLAEGFTLYSLPTPTFRDVPPDHAFYTFVETAYHQGIISGYVCGPGCLEFRPGNNVTRAQLCKIIVLAEQWTLYTPPTPTFRDVPDTDPFYAHIETAYQHGIISGYTCGASCLEFRPGNNATRGQISKIVYLAVTGP